MNDSKSAATLQSGRDWAARGSWSNALICFEHALHLLLREDADLSEILKAELLLARAHYELKNFISAEEHIRTAMVLEVELHGSATHDENEFRIFLVLLLLGQQRHAEAEREAKRAHRTAMRQRPLSREQVDRCFTMLRVARSALRGVNGPSV